MLHWYRSLLQLRHKLVMHSERTCRAELRQDESALRMHVPRENPRLIVACTLKTGAVLAEIPGWKLRLSSLEDGYAVHVWTR